MTMIGPIIAADAAGGDFAPMSSSFLNYGFAGALLFVLFWFLRALVVMGVKPFVESTLKNQAVLVSAMESVRASSERTAELVADLHRDFKTKAP